ncbi:MAG: hypothetical protein H7A41_04370 [Chlamydiales bacterium]|nr:hypothetical protein [Chlamydiales bacterium]
MFSLPNIATGTPRVNEALKDLTAAAIGVGVLRLAGIKYEVGQLSIKTLAFGAGTVAAGAALGREALIQFCSANIQDRKARNQMNKSPVILLALAAGAVAAIAATQYSRVGAYLPAFTQLSRNQAYALGGFATLAMAGLRYFGFADQDKVEKRADPRKDLPPVYDEGTHGTLVDKDMPGMQALSKALHDKPPQVRFATREQAQAYNDRIDALRGEEGHGELVKVEISA